MFDALSQDYPGPLEPVSLPDTLASRPTPPAAVQQLTPYDNTPAPDVDIAGQAPAASAEPIPKAIARTIHRALVAFSDAELARLRNLQTPEKSASNLYGAGRLAAQQNIDDVDAALNWLAAPVAAQAPDHASEKLIAAARLAGWTFTVDADGRYTMREALPAMAQSAQAPAAAGDALDAKRYRELRRKVCIVGSQFHILNLGPTYIAPDAAVELDSVLDAAIAAQRKGDA